MNCVCGECSHVGIVKDHPQTAALVYSASIDVIDEVGWGQGNYVGPRGERCMVGALMEGARRVGVVKTNRLSDALPVAVELARWAIRQYADEPMILPYWNDDPRRTEEEVKLVLKRAAVGSA